jgi:hypothetical protein
MQWFKQQFYLLNTFLENSEMKLSKLSAAVVFLGLTMAAADAFAARTARTTILSVFSSSDGSAFIRLDDNTDTNGAVCSSIARYKIDSGAAGKNGLLAAALTAKASGAEVQLDMPSCGTDALIQNVIVY